METEVWLPITGYEGLYEISNFGRVKSLISKGAVMAPQLNSTGYERVFLRKEGIQKSVFVHVLVARAFTPNPDGKPIVDHIDGDKRNNAASNLRWCTQKENLNFELAKKNRTESHRAENSPWFGKTGRKHPSSKAVAQYSASGEFLKSFGGLSEASRETNIDIGNISNCCRGSRKTAGGYIWRFYSLK